MKHWGICAAALACCASVGLSGVEPFFTYRAETGLEFEGAAGTFTGTDVVLGIDDFGPFSRVMSVVLTLPAIGETTDLHATFTADDAGFSEWEEQLTVSGGALAVSLGDPTVGQTDFAGRSRMAIRNPFAGSNLGLVGAEVLRLDVTVEGFRVEDAGNGNVQFFAAAVVYDLYNEVPAPGSIGLLGAGLLAGTRRRR